MTFKAKNEDSIPIKAIAGAFLGEIICNCPCSRQVCCAFCEHAIMVDTLEPATPVIFHLGSGNNRESRSTTVGEAFKINGLLCGHSAYAEDSGDSSWYFPEDPIVHLIYMCSPDECGKYKELIN